MRRLFIVPIILFFAVTMGPGRAWSHCEIPCGIYDDKVRMTLIFEHIRTINKSIQSINELQKGNNPNQLVRWVTNKEHHAEDLQQIVSQYFLTQRIQFNTADYDRKLRALHKLLVYSMKTKQSLDQANVDLLEKTAREFEKLYFPHTHTK